MKIQDEASSTSKDTKARQSKGFNMARYIFRIISLSVLEKYKNDKGQSLEKTIFNLLFYPMILFTINELQIFNTIFVILLDINIVEAVTFETVKTPITRQIITNIDFHYVNENHPEFYLYGIILFMASAYLSQFPKSGFTVKSMHVSNLITMISVAMLYSYISYLIRNVKGVNNNVVFNQGRSSLIGKLEDNLNLNPVIIEKDNITMNLILYQVESLENWAITPTSMPYLYNLTQNYLTFNNIIPVPYSAWSSAGTLVTQCGVPQIVTDYGWSSRKFDSISVYKSINCLPDYLASVGYNRTNYVVRDVTCQGLNVWRDGKHYIRKYNAANDLNLTNVLVNEFLPQYNLFGEKERFITWILNEDTHVPYQPRKWCIPRNINESKVHQQHDCLDQMLERFVKKFLDLKMNRHTVLVIFPDHLIMSQTIPRPRRLFMIFPGMEGKINKKELTYYDFAPTVLERIGIKKVFPGFPFGESAFSNKKGSSPSFDDLTIMYQFFSQSLNVNKGRKGFKCKNGKVSGNKICTEYGY